MQAVILAAGRGTRLGSAKPKPLTPIAPGLSLLSNQVDILGRLVPHDRIAVVVGYGADQIAAAHPRLRFIHNPRFAQTNTAASLTAALLGIDEDDVLWVNGDLYFERETAETVLRRHAGHSTALVNRGPTGPEQMKYNLHGDGSIAELSKAVRQPLGESLGMHVVTRADRRVLLDALRQTADHDYYEAAVQQCAMAGAIHMIPLDVGPGFCREIDFPHDLVAVRAHVAARGAGREPMTR